eukprot:10307319-Karenia_brevis.AAC.1
MAEKEWTADNDDTLLQRLEDTFLLKPTLQGILAYLEESSMRSKGEGVEGLETTPKFQRVAS